MRAILSPLLTCAILAASSAAFAQSQPVEYDKQLGEKYAQGVELQMGLYDDPELNAYIRSIGENLVTQLGSQPFDYSFKVIDSDISNAFALPGGPTYVTRGLLAMVNDESELAGVMAHEIIHVHQRHTVKQMRQGIIPGILRVPGAIVGVFSPTVGSLLQVPADLTDAVFSANYSRSHEKEADRDGIVIATNAGYDPNGLVTILSHLGEESELISGAKEKRSITNDHPITEKRLKYLEKDISKLDPPETTSERRVVEIDGMIYGQNPANGLLHDNNEFVHPDLDLHIAFPSDWAAVNTPVMVGAQQQNSEAIFIMSVTDGSQTPSQYADTLYNYVPEEYRSLIIENGPVDINGFEGHAVGLIDRSGGTSVYLRFVWLTIDGQVYQVAAYGLEVYKTAFDNSYNSIRRLTSDEKDNVHVHNVHLVNSRAGESLTELAEREGNVLAIDRLANMNGISPDHRFESEEQVKIVRKKKY